MGFDIRLEAHHSYLLDTVRVVRSALNIMSGTDSPAVEHAKTQITGVFVHAFVYLILLILLFGCLEVIFIMVKRSLQKTGHSLKNSRKRR